MLFNTPIIADKFDGHEQAIFGEFEVLLTDLVAEDDWLDRTPFEQGFIDLEVFETFLTLVAIAVISASMTDAISV